MSDINKLDNRLLKFYHSREIGHHQRRNHRKSV